MLNLCLRYRGHALLSFMWISLKHWWFQTKSGKSGKPLTSYPGLNIYTLSEESDCELHYCGDFGDALAETWAGNTRNVSGNMAFFISPQVIVFTDSNRLTVTYGTQPNLLRIHMLREIIHSVITRVCFIHIGLIFYPVVYLAKDYHACKFCNIKTHLEYERKKEELKFLALKVHF